MFGLPTTVDIAGVEYEIRSDFRDILEICTALNDPELSDQEKTWITLLIFYPKLQDIPMEHMQEAVDKCMWFINCGEAPDGTKAPKLIAWEQDYNFVVAAVNRVAGTEVRSVENLHWWTFIGYYQEIGECTLSHIVSIRYKRSRGKALEKHEQEWLRENRKLVDFKTKYTSAEEEFFKEWGG